MRNLAKQRRESRMNFYVDVSVIANSRMFTFSVQILVCDH